MVIRESIDPKIRYKHAEDSVVDHFGDIAYMSQLRQQMVRFAATQVRDQSAAEDLVQEALLGAVKNVQDFTGRAAFRSWVFAILRNKMVDFFRREGRAPQRETFDVEGDFDARGHWQADAKPTVWQCPESGLKQQQFMQVLELCLNKLPAKQARVFMMREFLGLTTQEICGEVGITRSNLNALLCRARMGLQQCLALNWLGPESAQRQSRRTGLFKRRAT
ncbi:MAG TPA: sigma-70 family RNA polymerase sigma factor [Marinagarivorans sp.]